MAWRSLRLDGQTRVGRGRKLLRRLAIEPLERRIVFAAQPIVNEILANNDNGIQDVDGDNSDFIELYNAGDASINLAGWYLTDDEDDLDKWQLPSVELAAGQYLVIFASGKDRAIVGSELHTNFALDNDGEYLALVRPNLTVASEFSPGFPPQFEDISYGVSTDSTEHVLIGPSGNTQVLVPPNGTLGTTWTQPGFTPGAGWQNGQLGVGYSSFDAPPPSMTVLQVDFNERGAVNSQPGFSSFVLNGTNGTIQLDSTTRTFGAYSVTVTDVSGWGIDDRLRSTPINGGEFTEAALLQDFIFSREQFGTSGFDVTIAGLTAGETYTLTAWSYDSGSSGLRTSDWTANGVTVEDYSFAGSTLTPPSNDTYRMGFVVTADGMGRIILEGRNDDGTDNFGVFLNALKLETGDTINSPASSSVRVDFNATTGGESGSANTEEGYATMSLDENGATINGVKFTFSGYNGATPDSRDRTTPADSGAFTLDQLYDDFIFTSAGAGTGMEILIEGLAPNAQYELVLRSFDGLSTTVRESTWTEISGASPVTIASPYSYNGAVPPTTNDAYAMRAQLTTSATGTLLLRGVQNGSNTSVVVNAIELTRASFDEHVGFNVEASMEGVNASVYVRTPFTVANPAAIDQLFMNIRYDAGFVAYLNGQEVARRNAPTAAGVAPAYNAAATLERSNIEALEPTTIDLTPFKHLLTAGSGNVLAIHGLNSAAADADFLIAPELRAIEITGQSLRFFETPTPGAANGTGVIDFVAPVTPSVHHGFYNAPFMLTLSTPTAGAAVYYTYDGSIPEPSNPAAILYSAPVLVDRTTVLRAGAVKADFASSPISTSTYIFLDDVINQTISTTNPALNPFGLAYPGIWQANAPADFNMDPRVVSQWNDNNPSNTDFGIREALQSIPTLSIVMDHDDLWNPSTGIYVDATRQGDAWRRPGSVELVDPLTGGLFQHNVGVQMHGAASRDNVRTKKHSFRLIFNNEFDGPGRLNYPLFDNSTFDDINTVVLKAAFTDSFATRTITDRYSPIDATYMRDVWMLESQRAMGSLAPETTYVHLYVNGLYWGVYYPTERVDDAYLASRLGGAEEDWDVIKDFNELFRGQDTAWNAMFGLARQMSLANPTAANTIYQQLQGKNSDGTPNGALPAYLDVDNFIDYMLLHIYAGVEDWPSHNWVAGRNRVDPGAGFRFYTWDQEIALDGRFRDRTEVNNSFTPGELFARLRSSPEFRLRFADRVQKHLFNDGALTVDNSSERWQAEADQIEAAIIGESARWGDAREGEVVTVPPSVTIPLMTVDLWRNNVADVLSYLPQHHSLALSRLLADGLASAIATPQFSQHGGQVPVGYDLTISGGPGLTVYYTTDGSDPRAVGGGVQGTAYAGPIDITTTITVKARTFNGSTWSALVEATFAVAAPADATNLRITEIHYNPAPTPGVTDPQDLEFIELFNPSAAAVSLDGVQITQFANAGYSFPTGLVLGAGERIVVAKNPAVFQSVYGTSINVAPIGFPGDSLSNGGERIALLGAFGQTIQDFVFDDVAPWPTAADGGGPSIELIDPFADPSNGANWRASATIGGSPGTAGGPAGTPGDFDSDNDVDGADFLAWQRGLRPSGATRADGDADGDGDVDGADLGLWRSNFGPGASVLAMSASEAALAPATSTTTFAAADAAPLAGRADMLAASSPASQPMIFNRGEAEPTTLRVLHSSVAPAAQTTVTAPLDNALTLEDSPRVGSGQQEEIFDANFADPSWDPFEQALDATFARW
jgi:hypothetical protein